MSLNDIEKRIKREKRRASSFKVKKVFLWVMFISFVIIVSGIAFIFSYLGRSNSIELDVIYPEKVSRGKPFDLDVSALNITDVDFQNASIFFRFSSGLFLWNENFKSGVFTEKIGDIKKGNLIKKHYKVIPLGDINSKEEIEVFLTYFNANNNRFEITKKAEVFIESSAFSLEVEKPERINKGSLFTFKVKYINHSGNDFSSTFLKAEFPDDYQFNKAPVPYSPLDKKFTLGPSLSQSENEIEISGVFVGESKKLEIPLKFFLVFNDKEYLVAEKVAEFILEESPVEISVLVNGNPDYIAKANDHLVYEISIKNKSETALKEVSLVAKLEGFVNEKSVKTDGEYDRFSRTITWNSVLVPSLSLLEPNAVEKFKVEVDVSSEKPSSLKSIVSKNLYTRLMLTLISPSLAAFSKEPFIKTVKETKVGSLVYFNVVGYRKDPAGIENYGPFPFKVNTPSSYTIHWYITNFGNDLNNVKIQAILPSGVKFIEGNSKSNINSAPYYDSYSNSVIWELGDVYSGSGILTGAIDGHFQLEVTPEEKDIGSIIPLLGPSIFTAYDSFTKKNINIVKDVVYSNDLFGINLENSKVDGGN